MEEVLGWIAVFIVAVVLRFKDIHFLDPALSLFITAYILWGVIKRLKETLFVFLQGIPKDVDLLKIEQELSEINNIQSIHHTHIWSLEGEQHIFTTHLKLEKISDFSQILEVKKAVKGKLKSYPFIHYTIETELYLCIITATSQHHTVTQQ